MFYEDLSEYTYLYRHYAGGGPEGGGAAVRSAHRRLNIGWLSARKWYGPGARKRYPRGPLPAGLVEKLEAVRRVNLCRGFHFCTLCLWARSGAPSGNGEIWVQGESGITYVAPDLITHYVAAHGYRPPQAFVDAVLAADLGA
ncbi:DUF7919 family protein [Streptomyces laurentii]|uniref:DUF7919 family protein n=1 Tax=Streptomyces laurentii TaxID=39478 RepID=UPI0036B86D04